MAQENVEVVRSVYDAFAQRDGATPFKHYAPDIEWENREAGLVGGLTYHGHEGVHALFHELLLAFREFEFQPLELTPVGDNVLVTVHEHAVGREAVRSLIAPTMRPGPCTTASSPVYVSTSTTPRPSKP